MPYLAEKFVLDHIKSRDIKHGDEKYTIFEAYLGTYSKKPKRMAARSKAKLEKSIKDFYKKLGAGGDAAVLLTAYQSTDARNALDMLAKAGLNIPLSECVRRVLENSDDMSPCTTTLEQAYKLYLAAQEGKSFDHEKTVRSRVGKFVETFGPERLLSDITPKETNANLEGRLYNPSEPKTKTTFNNHLGYVKTFVQWCAAPEQGFIRENMIAGMRPKTKEWIDPEYMKPSDVEKLFRALEAKGGPDLAYAILSFWCGMRQEEILRASEGPEAVEIDIAERYIVVRKCKGHTRGIKPRAFTIPDQALAWMKSMPDFVAAARTPNKKFRNHLKAAADEAGVALPENAGRHTFCTMFEAAHHDANALTAIAGNTESIRDRHYNGVAKPQDGRDYFDIMPKAS